MPYKACLSEKKEGMIRHVLNIHGKRNAIKLSSLTHQENTPWHQTVNTTGYRTPISLDLIQCYHTKN
ncbi:conserved hypothetical protein [Candidatus Liberibacter solanacearum]|uniref:hypothetical protein n=1 Tax=Candidatus Liberibacter solanacearum TaxID=556287 RepID=UPI0038719B9A